MARRRSDHPSPPALWVPGQDADPAALERMRQAFPKPREPMGEAWFMAQERRMYPLLLGDLDAVDDREVMSALEQTATGPGSFGPRGEWTDWFRYLLPRLVIRDWGPTLHDGMELVFTAFMAQHRQADGVGPYPEFRTDALATLGRFIMAPRFWPGGGLDAAACLDKREAPSGLFGWHRASGLLSASLFFCAKYLPPGDVAGWFRSVLAIPDRRWTAQVVTWLVGAHAILTGGAAWPEALSRNDPFGATWSWSHALHGEGPGITVPASGPVSFMPAEARAAILQVTAEMDADAFFEELLTDPALEVVASEAAGLSERFSVLYR